jgi:hypothetical protein
VAAGLTRAKSGNCTEITHLRFFFFFIGFPQICLSKSVFGAICCALQYSELDRPRALISSVNVVH